MKEDKFINKQGRVIIISSVSGGGKTSLIEILIERHSNLLSIITATSRTPRNGEIHNKDYIFLDQKEFKKRVSNEEFLEYALVHGNYYGVPVENVIDGLDRGFSVILNIDVQGKKSVQKKIGKRVLSFFIMPPDDKIWAARLRKRGTDSSQEIQRRLKDGRLEMEMAPSFDYQIINDNLNDAVERVEEILKKEAVIQAVP